MSSDDNTKKDEIAFLKARLDFVEGQYRSLQLNMKYQREAFIEACSKESNDSFLLNLAPQRYRSMEQLERLYSERSWKKFMYRHPFKFSLWWTARKLQNAVLQQTKKQEVHKEKIWQNIQSIIGGKKFLHIFFSQNFARGGGQKYMLQIIEELRRQNPFEPILVILGYDYRRLTCEEDLSIGVDHLDISILCHDFTLEERCHLAHRIGCTHSQTNAQWHFSIDAFSMYFFKFYKKELEERTTVVHHFCNWASFSSPRGQQKVEISYGPYNMVRDGVSFINKLVTDNQFILDETQRFLKRDGIEPIRSAICLYSKVDIVNDVSKNSESNPNPRIYWISRLDLHKRSNLIFVIGKKMQTSLPGKILNVHGYAAADSTFDFEQLPPSVKFHGPFNGLASLDIKPYDILIYTSYYDGLPITILESVALGMTVIAPDIAGIGEIIKDGETGILLENEPDDDVMADAYIAALERLLNDNDLRMRLAKNAQDILRERHSSGVFAQNVKQIFGQSRV